MVEFEPVLEYSRKWEQTMIYVTPDQWLAVYSCVFRPSQQGYYTDWISWSAATIFRWRFKDHTDDTLFTIDGASHTSRKGWSY